MTATPIRVSLDAKLFFGVAGTKATTELSIVGDVELSVKKGEAKTPRRGSRWQFFRGTLKEAEITFSIVDDPNDANLPQIIAAFLNDTQLAFYIADASGSSGKGIDADWEVLSMKRSEKVEDAVTYEFSIKPSWAGRNPAWN